MSSVPRSDAHGNVHVNGMDLAVERPRSNEQPNREQKEASSGASGQDGSYENQLETKMKRIAEERKRIEEEEKNIEV